MEENKMKVSLDKKRLYIYADVEDGDGNRDIRDEVFIEKVLGLKNNGDSIKLVRGTRRSKRFLFLETEKENEDTSRA
jgi:hypothetical protein